ncbi:MAG: secondary thiamine-phosphate synthase enzyme YjbQ [Fidelibacterota bacterium]
MFRKELIFATGQREDLIDISDQIQNVIRSSGIASGLCNIYVPHATSGIVVNENADPNLVTDVLGVLKSLAPRGLFLHDRIDGNGDAHIKAALVGPGETIPFEDGRLLLGTWQSVMLCEFDGPRSRRRVLVTLLAD